jgi:TRAP-type C4-dicarboxylate transport system substrate-binding protein
MTKPVKIKLGGYGPSTTNFSRSLKHVGDAMETEFGDRVDVKYVWNIMDFGYKALDILWLVEEGILTIGYQSSSYMTDRVKELGFVDLPFLFKTNEQARAAMAGKLGNHLKNCIEDEFNYRILGYFENGFRHISNRSHPVHLPSDMKGLKTRVLPSKIQAETFELMGAVPLKIDLTEAIDGIVKGTLDAQENPLANTVTYGVHKFHPYHTLSNHFYISRPIFAHRDSFDAMPDDIREALQREFTAIIPSQQKWAEKEEDVSRQAILDEGCEIVELTDEEHDAFAEAVSPLKDEARNMFGNEMFELLAEV